MFGRVIILGLVLTSQASASVLQFHTGGLESGVASEVGSVYRFDDVTTGVDALLTIDGLYNSASITEISSGGAFGSDDLVIQLRGWGDDIPFDSGVTPSYGEFTLQFVIADTTTATTLANLEMSSYDIDSTTGYDYSDTLWLPDSVSASLRSPTELAINPGTGEFNGFQEIALQGEDNTSNGGIEREDEELQPMYLVDFTYENVDSITWRWGLTGTMSPLEDGDGKARAMILSGNSILNQEVIPEPSSLIVWSLLGCVGITLGWRRRNTRVRRA